MTIRPLSHFSLLLLSCAVGAACVPPVDNDGPEDPGDIEPVCTEPAASVACRDQTLVALKMDPEGISPGSVASEDVGGYFHTRVDATAGGAFGPPSAFVYGKFGANGLEKVAITDDESFESMDWDISFRRFVIRLNSGVGGPSCVTAARTAPSTVFEDLADVPSGLEFNAEQFMSPGACELVPDGSGDATFPGVVLQNYWNYVGCLQMTRNVYVVSLADGHHVKLRVTHFYSEAAQAQCDEEGTTNSAGSGSIQLDWAFLD
jgi:hypothetical protein